ncbi:MAG TPA: aspartate aminotransferase family protein [Planctomycetaceae bacterium]|nr:aspartate aminotransferase family protein [Planctomycetaceae bacterium]
MPADSIQLISEAQTTDERFLRQIFVRDQMAEWSKEPLVMARADGVHYWDVAGRRYWDALSGIYVVSVGHNNRRVIEAIRQQLDRLHFSPPMHGTNPVAIQLANLLAEVAPGDLSTVKFETGGAEVTEAAIKLARQYHRLAGSPGKFKIIGRYLSWHGSTLGALSASGLKSRKSVNEPLAPGFLHVFPPTCYRCPFGKDYDEARCGLTCATILEDVIDMEGPETVAAVIVEPIGHTGGVIDPPGEYLPLLREICDRHNVLLIFDEIITGVGRTGRMFAAETFGVTPDVLCTGKGLSGGYIPISAMICRGPIADRFWGPASTNPGFVEGHTNEGHPVACAAGIAVLREIIERDLCANARVQGERLRAGFERLAGKYPVIGDIRGRGLFQAIEFVRDRRTKERFPPDRPLGTRVGRRALANGLLCRFDPHWIAFGPPLVSTAEHIDEMLAVLDRSLGEELGE